MELKVNNEIKLTEQIFDARFHPNSTNDLVAAVTIAGNVHLIEAGAVTSKIKKHHKGSSIRKVRFTKDGRLVTIAKTAKVHDLVANQTIHTLKRDDGKSTTFYSLMPFGNNTITAGDDDGSVFAWDLRTPRNPIFSSNDCEQYISDIDGKFETRRFFICTSGEGTLTAYDMRAKKMIEPQSELFEAGFQCVKYVDNNKKVVIGGEDGAIYVFNHNEWAHTSGKFAVGNDTHNRGKCSIDGLDVLPDGSTFLAGCSDGKLRCVTLWPHQILKETALCRKSPIESIHVSFNESQPQIVVSGESYLNFITIETNSDVESENEGEGSRSGSKTSSAVSTDDSTDGEQTDKPASDTATLEKMKTSTEDYLNIFH